MKKLLLFLLFTGGCVYSYSHELHFSLANIDVYSDSINIAIRITTTDLLSAIDEKAYHDDHGHHNHTHQHTLELNKQQIEKAYGYLISRILISLKSENMKLEFVSANKDGSHYWFKFKNSEINFTHSFVLTNKILIDLFNDQKNLVVIKTHKGEKGYEFSSEHTSEIISLN